jgi:hypothetical protein
VVVAAGALGEDSGIEASRRINIEEAVLLAAVAAVVVETLLRFSFCTQARLGLVWHFASG